MTQVQVTEVWFIEVFDFWTSDYADWALDIDKGVWASREAAEAEAERLNEVSKAARDRFVRSTAKVRETNERLVWEALTATVAARAALQVAGQDALAEQVEIKPERVAYPPNVNAIDHRVRDWSETVQG